LRLAHRLTTILPAMTLAEALETTRIHRVAGLTGDRTALVTTRPFRAPHHPISDVGRIEAFRAEKAEWKNSEDISVKYMRKEHDYIYYVGLSAISAMTVWVVSSAAHHITAEGGKLWADLALWRAKQPSPPQEPPPVPTRTAVVRVLPGQQSLFDGF
jgi:Magnesium chelatase, subunit ChlI